jgi:hypothetical protein
LIFSATSANQIVTGPSVNQVISIFTTQDVISCPTDDDIVSFTGIDEDTASATANEDIISTSTHNRFNVALSQVESDAIIAHHLRHIITVAAVYIVLAIKQDNVIASTGIDGIGT